MNNSKNIEKTFSKRIERKKLLEQNLLSSILNDSGSVFNSLFNESFFEGKSISQIRNTYLDDPNFTNYADSVFSREIRLKVRIREYLSDDPQLNQCYFEIKSKVCDVTFKKRLAFDRSLFEFLKPNLVRNYIERSFERISFINPDKSSEEIAEFLDEMLDILTVQSYSPVLTTSYRRHSFALRSNPEVRLTIDDSIQFNLIRYAQHNLPPYSKIETDSSVVVEIKSLVEDDMMAKFLMQEVFGSEESFSKYCCGIFKSHRMLQQHGATF